MNPPASSISFKETVFTFIFILLLAIIAVSYLVPPAVVPASAPVMEFSAERAIENLKVIAREPHPTGSVANARVRDYIVEQLKLQGLEPQIQRMGIASLMDVFPGPYGAGTVENILARLKGSNSTGVVLLMAHYDSVVPAPGATDDGSGVVQMDCRAMCNAPNNFAGVTRMVTDMVICVFHAPVTFPSQKGRLNFIRIFIPLPMHRPQKRKM